MATFLLRERRRTRECSRSRIQRRRRLGQGKVRVKITEYGNERRTQLGDHGMKCPVQRMTTISLSCPDTAFRSLIAPHTPEEFFDCYWEKQPLLIRRNGASVFVHDYHRLFSLGDLRKLAKQKSIRFGKHVNVCRYIRDHRENLNEKGTITDRKFKQLWLLKKATFQFHQPQHFKVSITVVLKIIITGTL